jgi:outer membrane receptor protein involved in Fe transport
MAIQGRAGRERRAVRASHWLLGTALIAWAGAVSAQGTRDRHRYDLQAQDLGSALRAFGLESGRDVVADARLLEGKRAEALKGEFDDRTALQRLLKGSGLHYALVRGAYIIRGEERAAPEGNGDDILVVGTRIRGAAPVGSPVTIIDRAAMEKAGRGTIQGLLETVPANFGGGPNEATVGVNTRNGSIDNTGLGSAINLRGLGSAATLVLFDGNRPALGGTDGTFADISLIPQIAIDRIEVLTDGASAIYGTDAVAGVVNFRFRNRFEGLDTSFRIGTADGDFEEYQLGAIAGKRWATGGIVIAYQYSDRDHLPGSQRRFATSDLRPFGGPDYRSKFTTPATIMAADGRIFGIPAGQDGRSLTAEQLLPGVQYYRDNQREDDLLPVQRSHAVFGAFDQELTDNLKVYARAFYAQRNFKFLQPNGFQQTVKVPASNAFYVDPIGTRQPLTVFYNFAADLGHEFRKGSVEGLSLNGGLEWSLGPWRIEASGNFGDQLTDFKIGNIANRARLAQALADSNPATAYNVFGDGGDTPEATIARIRGGARLTAHDQVWSAALRADGPLIALPTGMARLATGYEHRDERIRASLTSDTSSLQPATFSLLDGRTHRSIEAAYAELLVPVSGGEAQWLPGALDFSASVRTERYNDFGHTTNPKLGLAWTPLSGLKLRGSWGTSFHAPGFGDLVGSGENSYLPLSLNDPQSPTGKTIALGLFGYVDDLRPEKAETWSAGVDFSDWPAKGITASASYFSIRYKDRIATATSDVYTFLQRREIYGSLIIDNPSSALVQSYFDSPYFSNTLGITPDQVKVIVNGLTQNMARTTIEGVDFDLGYSLPVGVGTASIGLSGTRLFKIEKQVTASSPKVDVVGTFGNPVKFRLRGRAGFTSGGFDAGLFVNYVATYKNLTIAPVQRVHSWTTVDARLAYRLGDATPLKGAQIALSATNLFDRAPPFTVTHYFDKTVGYDPEEASPVGRLIAVEFSGRF